MGYGSNEMTAHGFSLSGFIAVERKRQMERGDAIERALSHADGNQVRAAYHRGAHWPERLEMAQWWSDHLDTLREGAEVLPFPAKRGKRQS